MPYDAVLITGPTASGKSAAALSVAEAIGGTIINTDSMQVYRELRILTARPPEADMERVPHLLFGHVSTQERYSAGRYAREAADALASVRSAGRVPVFVGGTGLYFGVLTEGIAEIPPVPKKIQDAAQAQLCRDGNAAFHAALKERDPDMAAQLRPADSQRLLRAYGVVVATGRSLAEWQRAGARPVLTGLRLASFVLDPPRPVLQDRIRARCVAMLEAGVRAEAAALKRLDPALPAAKILGLREILASPAQDDASLAEAMAAATRRYAKRQVTWFRKRMADWQWIGEPRNFVTEILSHLP